MHFLIRKELATKFQSILSEPYYVCQIAYKKMQKLATFR